MPDYVEAFDPEFETIVARDAVIERVAGGFGFTEGPIWRGDHLLFSDIPRSRTVLWRELPEGPEVTTFRTPTGNGNGLTLDKSGRLLTCEHSGRRVSRMEPDGSFTTVADRYEGKRLSSPNDIVVKSDGSIYFTDPPYGLPNRTEGKELPFSGVFRLAPDGSLTLLVDDFVLPNGLVFSPDESILYVNDTHHRHIRAFDVAEDGAVKNGHVFIDLNRDEPGSPDGMKVDKEGHVYCTGPGGVWVMNAEGKPLGRIITPEPSANMGWGEADGRTMYFTARTSVYRMRLEMTGIRPE